MADSYLVRVDPAPHGGAHVLWSDEPGQAMVFDDLASAGDICRDGPLALFAVSFVPAPVPLPRRRAPPAAPISLPNELRPWA